MGNVKNKYTKEYALCQDKKGKKSDVGIRGVDEWKKGTCRADMLKILKQVDWKGKTVLCVGVGRGEEVRYIKQAGAAKIVGVEFSPAIATIARKTCEGLDVEIVTKDILDYTKTCHYILFQYVVMIEVVEHIPRKELSQVMKNLLGITTPNGIVFISTPYYPVDNDVLKDGLKKEAKDSSDKYNDTQGMHCNRYTKASLVDFLKGCGFKDISTSTLTAFNKILKV